MSKSLQELRRQQFILRCKIDQGYKRAIMDLLEQQDREDGPGLTLREVTGRILKKTYVSEKDLRKIRPLMGALMREAVDTHPIVCRSNRYQLTRDEDEIIRYNEGTMLNGFKKVRAGVLRLPKQLHAIGSDRDHQAVVGALLTNFRKQLKEPANADGIPMQLNREEKA